MKRLGHFVGLAAIGLAGVVSCGDGGASGDDAGHDGAAGHVGGTGGRGTGGATITGAGGRGAGGTIDAGPGAGGTIDAGQGAGGATGCGSPDAAGRPTGWYFDTSTFKVTPSTDVSGGTPPAVTTQVDCATGALTIHVACSNTWHDAIELAVTTDMVDLVGKELTMNATASTLNWYKVYSKDFDWNWSDDGALSWSQNDISVHWNKGGSTAWPVREVGAQFGCPADAAQSNVTIVVSSFTYAPPAPVDSGVTGSGGATGMGGVNGTGGNLGTGGATGADAGSDAGGAAGADAGSDAGGATGADAGSDASGPVTHALPFDSTPNYSINVNAPATISDQAVDANGALTFTLHCLTSWSGDLMVTRTIGSLDLTDQELTLHATASGTATPLTNWYKMFTQADDASWTWSDQGAPSQPPAGSDLGFSWTKGAGTTWTVRNVGLQLSCANAGDYTYRIAPFSYTHL